MAKKMQTVRRKMSCVMDEIYTALWKAGCRNADMNLQMAKDGLRLHVRADYAPECRDDMETMAKMLCPAVRNPALAEAYWELAGGDSHTSDGEMNLVGQILDGAKVNVKTDGIYMDLFLAF